MIIIQYHSTIIASASHPEAADTTSSQILLSRAIADPAHSSRSRTPTPVTITTVYESQTRHIMTLGAAAQTERDVGLDGEEWVSGNGGWWFLLASSINRRGIVSSCSPNPWQLPELPNLDKGKDVDRGRPLERTPRYPNPLHRAESRSNRDRPAIEVDGRAIRTRDRSSTLHDDPNDPCAILDDQLLEPLLSTPQRDSVSEILSGSGSSRDSLNGALDAMELKSLIRLGRAGSRDASSHKSSVTSIEPPSRALTTVFNDCHAVCPEPTVPAGSRSQSIPNIGYLEHIARKADTLSDEEYSSSQEDTINDHVSTFSKLPTEINQLIYLYLAPVDFNSARHTCRAWYYNSLQQSLLETMIKRGGWHSSCQQEIAHKGPNFRKSAEYIWLLSRRIARECVLGPEWTGHGLSDATGETKSAFVQASTVDFTDVAVHYPESTTAGTTFTVSSCGKFLMAANGCLIYIYELNKSYTNDEDWSQVHPGSLRPVTSIICPHRVLACSMDTSSHRYAVAVLLDGRMGLVCDIAASNVVPQMSEAEVASSSQAAYPVDRADIRIPPYNGFHHSVSFLDRVSLDSSAPVQFPGRSMTAFVFPGIAVTRSGASCPDAGKEQTYEREFGTAAAGRSAYPPAVSGSHFVGLGGRSRSRFPARRSPGNIKAMPVESGPRSLYRNLCSEDDPPRSVAICPQRRCVAFGCSAGIELHWVDALTGQDLNRWFPLTAPSDFLFFLPPRKSVDSAKKLRLISSAAKPSDRAALHERSFGRTTRAGVFWERLGWSTQGDNAGDMEHSQDILGRYRGDLGNLLGTRNRDQSDHYRAVPLSDGYHILFTDPISGALCMGSDAPVGGPTKLLRKVWFKCPDGNGTPTVYAGGSDLRWGLRVVAAYETGADQSIWLFNVPADIFNVNQTSNALLESSVWQRQGGSREPKNMDWLEWWPDEGLQEWLSLVRDPIAGVLPGNMWPIRIRGQKIGTGSGVVDLAIDSSQGVIVWAFTVDGTAKVWRVNDGQQNVAAKLTIARDGTIRDTGHNGEDVEMSDCSLTPEILQRPSLPHQQSFDGTFSPDASTVVSTRGGRYLSGSYRSVNYDSEGDVIMEDVHDVEGSQPEPEYEADVLVQDQQVQYLTARWSQSSCRERWNPTGSNVVEQMRSVARIEIEIR
ncbi:F-box domain-containing protein [Rutstroemia sp. NJR-2017a WRK4]|nr:F-box domain-containing protein [Rutstroemia sp. NJR-2017a WRK4]